MRKRVRATEDILARSVRNDRTGCLIWQGRCNPKGYGLMSCNRKYQCVHRLIWTEAKGQIPDDMHVLHRCDNRRCVEIGHLFTGSNYDNIVDKMQKDRSGKKLCIAKVLEIKHLLTGGMSQERIANMYGVSQGTISHIKRGTKWAHVHDIGGAESVRNALESVN